MWNYDFRSLSPHEFELLVNDLISMELDVHFESFKPGKDTGIDGRYVSNNGEMWIIQSKHYIETGFTGLLRRLATVEYEKISRINPQRYFIATSIPLSVSQKDKITETLGHFIKSPTDIFGQDDLNSLLRKFPQIVKSWSKLWIQNGSHLINLIHPEIYHYGLEVLTTAQKNSQTYAKTDVHVNARNLLKKQKVIVIAGQPGIGKTTLAEQLCIEYVRDGYTLVAIEDDISEARKVLDEDKEQVFYFDDFLGSNYFDSIRCKKDSSIMSFITRIEHSSNKAFILTSRTNILDSGYSHSQSFNSKNLKNKEYIFSISDYSIEDKGKILYEMLWRHNIDSKFLETIISQQYHQKIIRHRNFNPRMIEFILNNYHTQENRKDHIAFIDASLNNPAEVWSHPYNVQLDDLGRCIVDFVVLSGGTITESHLFTAFEAFKKQGKFVFKETSSSDFSINIKFLSRSFIRRIVSQLGDNTIVNFQAFNPSVSDYVFNKYLSNSHLFVDMISYMDKAYPVKVLHLLNNEKNKSFIQDAAMRYILRLSDEFWKLDLLTIMSLASLLSKDDFEILFKGFRLEDLKKYFVNTVNISREVLSLCEYIIDKLNINKSSQTLLFNKILDFKFNYSDLEYLSELLIKYEFDSIKTNSINTKFYNKLYYFWNEDYVIDYLYDHLDNHVSYDFNESYTIDKKTLVDSLYDSAGHLYITLKRKDIERIVSSYSLDDIYRDISSADDDDPRPKPTKPTSFDLDFALSNLLEVRQSGVD